MRKQLFFFYIGLLNTLGVLSMFSCTGNDMSEISSDGSVEVSFALKPLSFHSVFADTRGGSTIYAGALTREQELTVNELCYFEFDGDQSSAAHCLTKGTLTTAQLSNPNNLFISGLSGQSGTHTLYFVANMGDVTGGVTANLDGTSGTTLAALQAMTFAWTHDASDDGTPSTAGTDFFLPMTGSVVFDQSASYASPLAIALTRRVARVNVSLISTDANFLLKDVRLVNVPKSICYSAGTSSYPDASVADNFRETAEAVDKASIGKNHTWYVPENRRASDEAYQPAICIVAEVSGSETTKLVPITATPNGVGSPVAYELLANNEYAIQLTATTAGVIVNTNTVDLSAGGTSNSYICNLPDQVYSFDGAVKGNGVVTPAVSSGSPVALTPNATYSVRVLWSMGGIAKSADTDGGNVSNVDDGIYSVIKKGSLAYDPTTGRISFATTAATLPAEAGNAVVALADGNNTILWSWHIWFTSYNPGRSYDNYKVEAQGHPCPLMMMKYNLGSIDYSGVLVDRNKSYLNGLFYQWGRKDPSLGFTGTNGTLNLTAGTHYYSDAGMDFVYSDFKTPVSIATACQSPMTFFANSVSPYLWVTGIGFWRDLWGNPGINWSGALNFESGIKTCFDPCPPGWKVPPRATWYTIFSTTGSTPNALVYPYGMNFYYTAVGSGPTTFYPLIGFRYGRDATVGGGPMCYSWASSPYNGDSSRYDVGCFSSTTGATYTTTSNILSSGVSVRCAHE